MIVSLTEQIDGEIEMNKEIGTIFKITLKNLKSLIIYLIS